MIEKMKFISISGPLDDFDRLVSQILSHYPIQLENALTELKSAYKLIPLPGNNPYREPYLKAKKIAASLSGIQPKIRETSMDTKTAADLIEEANAALERYEAQKTALKDQMRTDQSYLEQARLFQELDFDVPSILKFRHIKYRFGRVPKETYPKLEAFAEESNDTILYKCHETDHDISLIYFTPTVASDRIDAVFSSLQFERLFLPDQFTGTPEKEMKRLEEELVSLESQLSGLDQTEQSYLSEHQAQLLEALAVLESHNANLNVRKLAACTHHLSHPFYILCGWISEDEALLLQKELEAEQNTFFAFEKGEEHTTSIPPTKLKNNPFFKPFEMFVQMYGLPAYGEFDPTVLIAVTYSVFFGFMFGDVGQGFLLFLGGMILYKKKRMNLAAIVSRCGFFSMIFGCLFGSVFGFEDILPALWLKPTEAMTQLPFVGRLNTVFVVAIALGMGVILFTMILNMIVSFRNHDPEKTWFDTNGLAGFIFYLSLAASIVLYMSGHSLPASAILIVMLGVPLALIFLKEPLTAVLLKKKEKISGGIGMFFVQGFFELFEVLLSYFSNTLSFVRVGAFAVSHAAMMEVVLMLAGAETGNLSIPVVVIGNLFVCGMEGLIVGIQVLRLEYYELFSRFYRGNGREFKPFYEK